MFAPVFSQLPARLRRALAHVKAFAFLEDPPRAPLAPALSAAATPPSAACAGDRRRGLRAAGTPRAATAAQPCRGPHPSAGRSGRPAAPAQRCATPTTSGKATGRAATSKNRRASVPGGFLHH